MRFSLTSSPNADIIIHLARVYFYIAIAVRVIHLTYDIMIHIYIYIFETCKHIGCTYKILKL